MRARSDVEQEAVYKIETLTSFPRAVFSVIKSVRTEDIRLKFELNHKRLHEVVLDIWFSDPAQALLKEASK